MPGHIFAFYSLFLLLLHFFAPDPGSRYTGLLASVLPGIAPRKDSRIDPIPAAVKGEDCVHLGNRETCCPFVFYERLTIKSQAPI